MSYVKNLSVMIFFIFPLAVWSQVESSKNNTKQSPTLYSKELGKKISASQLNSQKDHENGEASEKVNGEQGTQPSPTVESDAENKHESNQLVSVDGDFHVQKRANGILWFLGTFLVLLFAVFVLI